MWNSMRHSPNFLGAYDLGAGNSAQSHSGISYFGGTATINTFTSFQNITHVQAFPVNRALQHWDPPS